MASSSDDEEANNSERFDNLCHELNMDEETSKEAWCSYEKISTNYTLEVSFTFCVFAFVTCLLRIVIFVNGIPLCEFHPLWYCDQIFLTNIFLIIKQFFFQGDSLHWLACALYVACRKSVVPTVDSSATVEGNCVSLTRLLRAAKLRWVFFDLFEILHHFSFSTDEYRYHLRFRFCFYLQSYSVL